MTHTRITCLVIALACVLRIPASGQFTAGNVVVYEVGTSGSFPTNGSQIVLREFTPLGTPAAVVNIPTSGPNHMIGASSSLGGGMSLTPGGERLVLPGYADFAPTGVGLATTSSAAIPRVVGTVDATGNFVQVFASSALFDGTAIFSAASDSTNFWGAGQAGGVGYFGPGPETVVTADLSAATHVAIAGGQLSARFANNLGTLPGPGIHDIGTGLPTTSGQPQTQLIDVNPSPPGFQFNAARDVCYVAGFGVEKWTLSGGVWSLAYTLPLGVTATMQHLCVDFSGTDPVIHATTFAPTRLLQWVDMGSPAIATPLASTIAIWLGIALSPTPSITTSVSSTPVAPTLLAWLDGDQLFLNQKVDATVLDALGKVVAVVRNSDRISIDRLRPGIYFVRTMEGGVLRFVRE